MNKKRLYTLFFVVALLLSIPFTTSQFTSEVQWDLFDYVVAGVLLFVAAILFNMILLKINQASWRMLFITVLFIILILIWVDLAVGIFNFPFSGD